MANQKDEVLNEHSHAGTKHVHWGSLGILFSVLVVIVAVAVVGYGYFQLSQTTTSLGQTITSLQTQLSNTQQNVEQVRQTVEKSQQKTQETIQEEQRVTELYSQVIAVDNLIDQLPLPIPQDSSKSQITNLLQEDAGESSWLQRLSKIVVIRYIGKNELPLTVPQEKLFLYQNLHAQFQATLWAVLHHNNTVYQNSLERAKTWIQRYFVQEALETKTVLQALENLQSKTLVTS